MCITEEFLRSYFSFHILSVVLQRNQHHGFIWEFALLALHFQCRALSNRQLTSGKQVCSSPLCSMHVTLAKSLSLQGIKSWSRYLRPFHQHQLPTLLTLTTVPFPEIALSLKRPTPVKMKQWKHDLYPTSFLPKHLQSVIVCQRLFLFQNEPFADFPASLSNSLLYPINTHLVSRE